MRLPLHCRAAVRSGDVHTAGPPGPCGRWACAGRAPTHPQRAPPVTASQASTHLQWPRGQSEMPGPVRTLGPRAWCPRKSGPHPSAVATGATRTTRPLRTLLVIRSSPPHIRSGAARTGGERSAERACANVPSAALHERVSVRSTRQDPANQTFARGTAHVRARVPTCAPGVPTCAPGPHVSTPGRPHVRTRGSYLAGARTRTFGSSKRANTSGPKRPRERHAPHFLHVFQIFLDYGTLPMLARIRDRTVAAASRVSSQL